MASPSEDIEMRDAKDLLSLSPRGTAFVDAVIRPVTEVHTLSSHENSPKPTANHDIHTLVSDVDNDLKPPPSKKIKTSQSPPGSKPISAAGAGTTAKPKSAKAPRARSRSPTPPPQRQPPLQTIRLDIVLGGPDKYEVDITSLAKATGQRPTTPPPPKPDTSDSDGEETDRAKPKKKKVPVTILSTLPTLLMII